MKLNRNGELVCENVKEDLEITVDFVKKGIMDYLLYIVILLVIVGAAALAVVCAKKKIGPFKALGNKKNKMEKSEKHDAK